jgi:hypothetical protein
MLGLMNNAESRRSGDLVPRITDGEKAIDEFGFRIALTSG